MLYIMPLLEHKGDMKTKNPFSEFEQKEQWIIFLISVLIALLLLFGTQSNLGIIISAVIAITISLVGYITALLHIKLNILAKRIDLQISKTDEDSKSIAINLEHLIDMAQGNVTDKKMVRKHLDNIVQNLTDKGIEDNDLRNTVLNYLNNKEWTKAVSISCFGLPGDWTDPYWFSYLCLQIGRAAELKNKGDNKFSAKRYFIYNKKVVEDYKTELKLLIEAHGKYVEPFLFYTDDINKKLMNSSVELIDLTFIEDKVDNLVLWRDPNKNGQVEKITGKEEPDRIATFNKILDILQQHEKEDKKHVL